MICCIYMHREIKTVQDQIFKCRNLTLSMQDSQHTVIIETRCLFMFHCLHYFFCLISYISFSVLSFQQNHLQKKTDEHGFSTSSNLHSLHELYPQEGIAQIDALVNRRVNFYPHFLLQHSELMQGYITFYLHPTLFLCA